MSDGASLTAAGATALLDGDWATARDCYEQALAVETSAEALEGFAAAVWWLDDVDAAIDARERAYALRRDGGETPEAALLAALLAWDYGAMRGASAVANGWLLRARRLSEELPPSAAEAWLSLIEASFHIDTNSSEVLRLSTEAADHAHAHGGLEVEMTARTLQGLALVSLGRVEEGNRLLDEGTAAATSGELHDPIAVGSCCCNMIIACERSRDFDRAGQWCDRLAAYCERTSHKPLLALCRAHHGTVLTMRGEWDEAEENLAWAASELATLRPPLAGYARARLAELRRRQGRARDAQQLLTEAGGHVLVPLVRAALALDDDDPVSALIDAERYLHRFGDQGTVETAAALEPVVPIRIRLGELDLAREVHDQLEAITEAVGTTALRAGARVTAGSLALADHDAARARQLFEDAVDLHEANQAPFEVSLARLALAESLAAEGREDTAREQAVTALTTLDALGAKHAARVAGRLVTRLGGRRASAAPGGLTRREVDVLVLVAEGLSNAQIAERLVVSEHTVHRHLSNIYTRLGVSSRAAAVAIAAEHELLP